MPRYAVFTLESGTVQNSLEFEYCNLIYSSLNPIDITDYEAFYSVKNNSIWPNQSPIIWFQK